MPVVFKIAFKIAVRELRSGFSGLKIFIFCMILGICSITIVQSLIAGIQQGIEKNAKALLGGDLAITLNLRPATPQEGDLFKKQGQVSHVTELRTMASFNHRTTLAELKVVDSAYPLLGNVITKNKHHFKDLLNADSILVGEGILTKLGVKQGDALHIGDGAFRIAGILEKEPDRLVSTFMFGPRILMTEEAFQKTGLNTPDIMKKHRYRILLSDPQKLPGLKSDLQAKFPKNSWKITAYTDENQQVSENIERLSLFLTLSALSSLLIGGIGISTSIRYYLQKKQITIATLKAIGATHRQIFTAYLLLFLLVGTLSILFAEGIGIIISAYLRPIIAAFLPLDSALIYADVLLRSAIFGYLALLTFGLPPLGNMLGIKPSIIFRGGGLNHPSSSKKTYIASASALFLLILCILFQSNGDRKIAYGFILVSLACFFLFFGIAIGIKRIARHYTTSSPLLRIAIRNLYRKGNASSSIFLVMGVGFTLLTALTLTEKNLQLHLHETLPEESPSLFVMDIQADELSEFQKMVQAAEGFQSLQTANMVQGRIAAIKAIPIEKALIDANVNWAAHRERGFSATDTAPANAILAEGQWWPKDYTGENLVSMDRKIAKGFGMKIGDRITLDIAGQLISAKLHNTRNINYASMQVNFAMILNENALREISKNHIATIKLTSTAQEFPLMEAVNTRFPGIAIIRVEESLARIAELGQGISTALKTVICLILASGIAVFTGAVIAAQQAYRYDAVILKTLGASRNFILKMLLLEYLLLGGIAFIFASLLGSASSWLILQRFRVDAMYFLPATQLITISITLCGILVMVFLLSRNVLLAKPAAYLRNE